MANVFRKSLIFFPAVIFLVTSCASQKDIIYLNDQLKAFRVQSKKDREGLEKSIEELTEGIEANEARQEELEEAIIANEVQQGELRAALEASEARHRETERILKEALEAREVQQGELRAALEAREARHRETERILKKDQESLRLSLAQLGADLGGIGDNIQGLTGRVEELSHLLKSTIEEDTSKEDAMASQMKGLSFVTEDLKLRIQSLENYVSSEIAAIKEKAALEKTSPPQEIGKNDSSVPHKKELTESEAYDRILGYYKDGRYEKAIADFRGFLKSYPESDLADNAHFWIGECLRALGKYEEAILAYQRVINGYPKGNKVPSAMLHQGFAFEKIKDKTTASLVFKKLVKQFPNTKEAEIAKKRISEM